LDKHKQTQLRLEQLSDAVDTLGEGFLLYDKDQKLIVVNKMIREMLGELGVNLKPGVHRKAVENTVLSWLETDGQKARFEIYVDALGKNKVTSLKEARFSTPTGRHLVLNERVTRDRGIVSVIREETDAIKKQNELGETNELLSIVYQNIPIGICVIDANDCILSWNEKYLSLMDVAPSHIYKGITLEQHLINVFDVFQVDEVDAQTFTVDIMSKMTASSFSRGERHLKSGKIVEIARSTLPGGGYVCTFNDVTLEKSTQLLLKESENRYRKMVELSPEAILVHKDGIIIYANAASIKLLEALSFLMFRE